MGENSIMICFSLCFLGLFLILHRQNAFWDISDEQGTGDTRRCSLPFTVLIFCVTEK